MFAKQYSHRLPADYDMSLIRQRAETRGRLWDDLPGLAFKAFVARERGHSGAVGNEYASVYLWLDAMAAGRFVMGDTFQAVIDGFGRPNIDVWLPLAAAQGPASQARTLYREDVNIADSADRPALLGLERQRHASVAEAQDTVACVTAVDVSRWTLIRLTLSARPADASRAGTAWEVLHLARPGLARLA